MASAHPGIGAPQLPPGEDGPNSDYINGDADFGFDSGVDARNDYYEAASLTTHIPESNKGYQMMLRLGWVHNTGIGPQHRQGRVDPVPFVHKSDMEGVGVASETAAMLADSTRTRKAMESELIARETEADRVKRETKAERDALVKEDVKSTISAFYCATCSKQYTKISEYEVHLSSYDHNHRKRFKEMQEMSKRGVLPGQSFSSKRTREDKEKAREEREFKRLQDAAAAKSFLATVDAPNAPPPLLLPVMGNGNGSAFADVPPASSATSGQSLPLNLAVGPPDSTSSAIPAVSEAKVAFGLSSKKQPVKFSFSMGKKK
ncbi:hypothetical protein HDU83_009222 [Entophlyctis luteolus]|nr:hypothetical protein HDU83_009222 [Entophlyctis luteolus]